jgi:microcin C transport system permease protein
MVTPLIWWGYNESNPNLAKYPAAPNRENWLGTDDRGRDVFVRLLYGFRLSMFFAIVAFVFSLTLGILVGGLQGFFGGKFDLFGQRLVEMWDSLPAIFVVILVVNVFEPTVFWLIVTIVAFLWVPAQYYIRAETLRLRNREFAKAATSFGASHLYVFFQHIVPNAITSMVTLAPFLMNRAILFLAILDYLGLGVRPPAASLGEIMRQGRDNFLNAWWLGLYPFTVLVVTLILLNFVGEGVRKAFDPRAA